MRCWKSSEDLAIREISGRDPDRPSMLKAVLGMTIFEVAWRTYR
ncbi:MAG: hypothetical protein ACK5KM_00265 [Hyphomicrobiaceae bacterium]